MKKTLLFTMCLLLFAFVANAQFTMELSSTPETCPNNGTITVDITNTEAGAVFSFVLYNGDGSINQDVTNQTATGDTFQYVFTSKNAGTYKVKAQEEKNGSITSQEKSISIDDQVVPLEISADVQEQCGGMKIIVNVAAGNPMEYRLTKEGTAVIPWQPGNELTLNSPFDPGVYKVEVKDNCNQTQNIELHLAIQEPQYSIRREQPLEKFIRLADCDHFNHHDIFIFHPDNKNIPKHRYPINVQIEVENPNGGSPTILNKTINWHEEDPYGVWEKNQMLELTDIPYYANKTYNYKITLTDACDGTFEQTDQIKTEEPAILLKDEPALCGARYIYIGAYNWLAPPLTVTFTDYPSGFKPSDYAGPFTGDNYTATINGPWGNWPNDNLVGSETTQGVPEGDYTIKIESCGVEIEKTITITNKERPVKVYKRGGCGPDNGSVRIRRQGDPLEEVKIIEAPAEFLTQYGPLPYDFSNGIMQVGWDKGSCYIGELPIGTYKVQVKGECNQLKTQEFTLEKRTFEADINIDYLCASAAVNIQCTSDLFHERLFLQRYDPNTDKWVHPITGVPMYPHNPIAPDNGALEMGTQDNADPGNITSFSGSASNIAIKGKYRVVMLYEPFGTGTPTQFCEETLEEFMITDPPINIINYNVLKCTLTGNATLSVEAEGIQPLKYQIIKFNGNNISTYPETETPVWTDIEEGEYSVQITDACGNTKVVQFSVTQNKMPLIKSQNLCEDQNGKIYLSGAGFFEVKWFKELNGVETNLNATGYEYNFTPFHIADHKGKYIAKLYDPLAATNEICSEPIILDLTTITEEVEAGTGKTEDICIEGTEMINLFDYIEGEYNNWGTWSDPANTGALNDETLDVERLVKTNGLGTYIFNYYVKGHCTGEDETTVTLNIKICLKAYNDINQTPQGKPVNGNVLTNDMGNGLEVTDATITVNGTTYTLEPGTSQTIPNVGDIVINTDGSYTFAPDDDFTGTLPDITYTVKDENGITDTASLSIKVIPNPDAINNNPPIAQNDTYTIEQNQTATVPVLANDSDPDGDDLTVTNVTAKGSGTSTVTLTDTPQDVYAEDGTTVIGKASVNTNGEIIFTPADNFIGDVPFDYTISDGNGGEDTATATVTVLPSNTDNNVYANDDVNTGNKGEIITGGILDNDIIEGTQGPLTVNGTPISGDNTSVTLPGGEGTLTFNPDGTYTFTPNPDFVGTVDIPYTVCNTNGQCDRATLHLTTLDEPVKAKDDAVQTPKGKPVTANVLTNDKGSDIKVTKINGEDVPATGSKTITVTGGSLTIYPNGTYTFTPNADFTGKVPTITYTIKDKYGKEDTAKLDITVVPDIVENQNDAPVAINDIRVTKQGKADNFNVLDNDHDPDNDGITVTEIKLVTTVGGSAETVSVPASGSITKDVYDGSRKTGTITIHSNGTTTFTPEANFAGQVPDIEYTIQDDNAAHATATAKIKITVMPDSKNSVFANDDYGVARNAAETIEVKPLENDFDPEGDTKSLVSVQVYDNSGNLVPKTNSFTSQPAYNKNGTEIGTISIDFTTGKVSFKGKDNFKGTIALPYVMKDEKGATSSATIYLTQLAEGSTPLPIELVSFDARLQGNNVELTWVSATEINNDFYSIYKSNDGETWKFWKDVQGAGNSSVELSYAEMDYEPYQGENYYKLSQTDFDGTTEELGIRVVRFNAGNDNFTAYPNPTDGLITIDGAYNNLNSLRIVSALGAVVTDNVNIVSVSARQLKLDFSNLSNGTYFIHLDNAIIQIVKQ